jgi:hypothetical protein
MVTHNEVNPVSQIYAYDFAMPVEEIQAVRPGTVVDFFDWVPDNTQQPTSSPPGAAAPNQTNNQIWNFIAIRHDRENGGAPVPGYDRDENGPTLTYAVYGHGRNGSVRQLFATKLGIPAAAITPANIIGQAVQQGQPIMLAGHTGISAFNHLHLHVVPDWTNRQSSPNVSNAGRETIPFVFSDVPGDGVCKSTHYYTSGSPRNP